MSITVDNTLGACYLGAVVSAILFGMTNLQAYVYFKFYRKDSSFHKLAVGVLWGLDLIHLILTIHSVYAYTFDSWGVELPINIVWSTQLQTSINVMMVLIVQSLYAIRVWKLGNYHHGLLGYVAASVVGVGFAVGIVTAYEVWETPTFAELSAVSWSIYASFAAASSIDMVISILISYYLLKSRKDVTRLDRRIKSLVHYTLASGFLTSACSFTVLLSYILMPNNFIFLALEFVLTKLYVNSFLAMLNSRERHSFDTISNDAIAVTISSVHTRSPPGSALDKRAAIPLRNVDWDQAGTEVKTGPRWPPV